MVFEDITTFASVSISDFLWHSNISPAFSALMEFFYLEFPFVLASAQFPWDGQDNLGGRIFVLLQAIFFDIELMGNLGHDA